MAFSADSQYILAQNMVEKNLLVFKVINNRLEDTGQRLQMKGGPAAIRTAEKAL